MDAVNESSTVADDGISVESLFATPLPSRDRLAETLVWLVLDHNNQNSSSARLPLPIMTDSEKAIPTVADNVSMIDLYSRINRLLKDKEGLISDKGKLNQDNFKLNQDNVKLEMEKVQLEMENLELRNQLLEARSKPDSKMENVEPPEELLEAQDTGLPNIGSGESSISKASCDVYDIYASHSAIEIVQQLVVALHNNDESKELSDFTSESGGDPNNSSGEATARLNREVSDNRVEALVSYLKLGMEKLGFKEEDVEKIMEIHQKMAAIPHDSPKSAASEDATHTKK